MHTFYNKYFISREKAIIEQYKKRLNEEPNLENPTLFTEKLQWLKLNWYDPTASALADKYRAREIVEERIGSDYLIEVYSVYNSVKEIDIDELPDSFVLKATHGSGFNIVCKNKYEHNWKLEKKKMKKWMAENYYWRKREWVYKDITPKIICEKFLNCENDNTVSISDYKFYCFNGIPYFCQVIRGRGGHETIDFFDTKWKHMPFTGMRLLPNSSEKIEKPKRFEEMLEVAEKLSNGFPFVRVDLYYVKDKIYFGEMTFFPTSGMGKFKPSIWNKTLGDLLVLPDYNIRN